MDGGIKPGVQRAKRANPRIHPPKGISAREAAGSRLRNARYRTDIREIMLSQMAAAHFAGSLHFLITYLGFRFAHPRLYANVRSADSGISMPIIHLREKC